MMYGYFERLSVDDLVLLTAGVNIRDPLIAPLLLLILTWVSIYIGILASRHISYISKPLVTSAGLSIVIWLAFDFMSVSSQVGATMGISANPIQLALLSSFVLGLMISSGLHKLGISTMGDSKYMFYTYILLLAVIAHGFGEGIIVGFDLATKAEFEVLETASQATSYLLHKVAEGFLIGLPLAFTSSNIMSRNLLLSWIGALPVSLGSLIGYKLILGIYSAIMFAAGGGFLFYSVIVISSLTSMEYRPFHVATGMIVAFAFLYIATVLHFTVI